VTVVIDQDTNGFTSLLGSNNHAGQNRFALNCCRNSRNLFLEASPRKKQLSRIDRVAGISGDRLPCNEANASPLAVLELPFHIFRRGQCCFLSFNFPQAKRIKQADQQVPKGKGHFDLFEYALAIVLIAAVLFTLGTVFYRHCLRSRFHLKNVSRIEWLQFQTGPLPTAQSPAGSSSPVAPTHSRCSSTLGSAGLEHPAVIG
jgi:hypothetical protein